MRIIAIRGTVSRATAAAIPTTTVSTTGVFCHASTKPRLYDITQRGTDNTTIAAHLFVGSGCCKLWR